MGLVCVRGKLWEKGVAGLPYLTSDAAEVAIICLS
jgi:hypothetical protein